MTILETTTPALENQGMRSFDLVTEDDRIQVLYQEDVSLYDQEPRLAVTGNIPDNRKLGLALLNLSHRLLNTMGNRLPQ